MAGAFTRAFATLLVGTDGSVDDGLPARPRRRSGLTTRWVFALAILFIVASVNHLLLTIQLEEAEGDLHLAEDHSAQTLLATHVQDDLHHLADAPDAEAYQAAATHLRAHLDEFRSGHARLVHGGETPDGQTSTVTTRAVLAVMAPGDPEGGDAMVHEWLAATDAVLALPHDEVRADHPAMLDAAARGDDAITVLQATSEHAHLDANSALTGLQNLSRFSLAVQALLLIVLGWAVFRPMTVNIDREVNRLGRLADDLEQEIEERTASVRQHAAALERSNKELEQFAYVASHDLQEPLRVISGYVQILDRKYGDSFDDKARHYIERVVAATQRMQGLIQDLLEFSRVGTRGRPLEPTDTVGTLDRVLEDLSMRIQDSDAVVTHDDLPDVLADGNQLHQLFQNLVANAIKYNDTDQPKVHISAERDGALWQFQVTDNGIGIDERHAERIFTIFQRLHTSEEYDGTGIGLALCKKIIDRHGGRIWVTSEGEGRGSTFHFTLRPVPEDRADGEARRPEPLREPAEAAKDRAQEVV